MKSPINYSASDLNPPERVSLGPVLLGGRFPVDASRRIGGVVLAIGGGVDLSPIVFLCRASYFWSRVSGGAIVTCLTDLEEKKGVLLLFAGFIYHVHS